MSIGLLFLAKGRWNGKSLLTESWVSESTRTISRTDFPDALSGYGYLWWTAAGESVAAPRGIPPTSYTAAGAGGHFMTIVPSLSTVIVTRVNTFDPATWSPIANPRNYSMFVREILAAHPDRAA